MQWKGKYNTAFQPEIPSRSTVATSESVGYVALVGTVFSFAVAVGRKTFAAPGTDKFVYRPLPDLLRVLCPPFLPAGFTAENLPFLLRLLLDFRTAFPAPVSGIHSRNIRRGEAVPAAEALDGIFGDTKFFPNIGITPPHPAETGDFFFLFVSHFQHLLNIRRFGGLFEGVFKPKKNSPQNKLCFAGCPL